MSPIEFNGEGGSALSRPPLSSMGLTPDPDVHRIRALLIRPRVEFRGGEQSGFLPDKSRPRQNEPGANRNRARSGSNLDSIRIELGGGKKQPHAHSIAAVVVIIIKEEAGAAASTACQRKGRRKRPGGRGQVSAVGKAAGPGTRPRPLPGLCRAQRRPLPLLPQPGLPTAPSPPPRRARPAPPRRILRRGHKGRLRRGEGRPRAPSAGALPPPSARARARPPSARAAPTETHRSGTCAGRRGWSGGWKWRALLLFPPLMGDASDPGNARGFPELFPGTAPTPTNRSSAIRRGGRERLWPPRGRDRAANRMEGARRPIRGAPGALARRRGLRGREKAEAFKERPLPAFWLARQRRLAGGGRVAHSPARLPEQ